LKQKNQLTAENDRPNKSKNLYSPLQRGSPTKSVGSPSQDRKRSIEIKLSEDENNINLNNMNSNEIYSNEIVDFNTNDEKSLYNALVKYRIIDEGQTTFSQYDLTKILMNASNLRDRAKDEEIMNLRSQNEELISENDELRNCKNCKQLEKELNNQLKLNKSSNINNTSNKSDYVSSKLIKKYKNDIEEINKLTEKFYENYLNLEVDDDS